MGNTESNQHAQEQTQKRLPGIDVAEGPRYVLPCGVVLAEKTFKPLSNGSEKSGYNFFNPGDSFFFAHVSLLNSPFLNSNNAVSPRLTA
jgi:hypothetical protein